MCCFTRIQLWLALLVLVIAFHNGSIANGWHSAFPGSTKGGRGTYDLYFGSSGVDEPYEAGTAQVRPSHSGTSYSSAAVGSSQATHAGSFQMSGGRSELFSPFRPAQTASSPVQSRYRPSQVGPSRRTGYQRYQQTSGSPHTTYHPVQSTYRSSMGNWKPQAVSRPVGSTQEQASPAKPAQRSSNPGSQNWQSPSVSSGHPYAEPEQNGQTSRPAQGNYQHSQTRFTQSSEAQHSDGTRKPAAAKPVQRWRSPSVSPYAKPEQNRQPSRPAQGNYQHSQTRFTQSSEAQHSDGTRKPAAAKPVQRWRSPSVSPYAKPEQNRQTSRPAQGNYQHSQTRFPASSVAHHAGGTRKPTAPKPVQSGSRPEVMSQSDRIHGPSYPVQSSQQGHAQTRG
ncbi:filaggrin-2-like isoform X1 [Clupea harengus]|uniref:Filaggrin-2-like isoform X1 n=1 Tax=Clupea harengus TaxID=7950 RepID=A0A6P8FT99_CLUHA|nr:filaggrin-2-like isoform X1 [Clupea harengus]XP_031426685.1 filaggrin-2-like isoform X1 [Clupea harengus]XP_042564236.1 filaggrin-2-like isoform X1 [Clupea harengus]